MVQNSLTRSPVPDFQYQQRAIASLYSASEYFNPVGHFNKSLNCDPVSAQTLRSISKKTLFSRAIERISNAVVAMPWTIAPPEELSDDEGARKKATELTKALSQPNNAEHDLYSSFVKAVIRDILVMGVAAVERQPGTEGYQPFWLWVVPPEKVHLDGNWDASREGIDPKFWYCQNQDRNSYRYLDDSNWIPILSKNLFLIQNRSASNELFPPSPVACAYERLNTWLDLDNYQARIVNNPVRDYMITVKNATHDELQPFRDYWKINVVGSGEVPILAGEVDVIKFGARNDEELFLKFSDYLAGLIAIEFGLSKRDYGIDPHDNRSTMGPAADLTFQDAILPIATCVIENLNIKVIDFYAPGYTLTLTDTEPRKESEEADTASTLYTNGIITKDESRRRVGEKPLSEEGGDKFFEGKPGATREPPVIAAEPPIPPVEHPIIPPQFQSKSQGRTRRKSQRKPKRSSIDETNGVQLSLF
jgi:hypothetical protein